MPYIVSSHGVPIGITDLGFVRIGGPFRSGWFQPNAEGERLMPVITGVPAAARAYARHRRATAGREFDAPLDPTAAILLDEAKAALERVAALRLTLHHEDGTLIPTESVGIQDMQQLLELGRLDDAGDADDELRGWSPEEDALDARIEEAVGHDLEIVEEMRREREAEGEERDESAEWTPDDELPERERYQVHVILLDEDEIP